MDSHGGFHEVETDGKLILEYHHPKYKPIPQAISGEATSNDHLSQLRFLCPRTRWEKENTYFSGKLFPLDCSPEYVSSTTRTLWDKHWIDGHHVLPLFWCNNEKFSENGGCCMCGGTYFGTDYYFCEGHNQNYHKECVESPPKIKHPYHPKHSLQLFFSLIKHECLCCGRETYYMIYHCTICQVFMHLICAMKSIPFVIDQPKRHHHPLTFFPRCSLTCNVCGILRKNYPTYFCVRCNFVAHKDCMYFPRIIKISRHHHRISYISSLQSREWSCGVCHQSIDCDYGAYTCEKCGDYAVHSGCALRKDVCDGLELEGVPEEDDIEKDDGPFVTISEGVILHFLHEHRLLLKVNIVYDEKKLCEACVLPIYEGNFYSCMECDFILHETCANSRRRIQHALYPRPLTLKTVDDEGFYGQKEPFQCDACYRLCCGFVYQCHTEESTFNLDVRCASISEPFVYKGHEHPLFAAINPTKKPICHVCKRECYKQLNCIKCDFIVCIICATLPYEAKHKYDEHFLTILFGERVFEKDWCEVCERNFGDTNTKVVYWYKECYSIFHIECLFGAGPYLMPGKRFYHSEIQFLRTNNFSRPICDNCKNPCQVKMLKGDNFIVCSFVCLDNHVNGKR